MSRPRVVVTRPLEPALLAPLYAVGEVWTPAANRAMTPAELLAAAVPGAEALVTLLTDVVDARLVAAAGPGLRVVANVAAGCDNLDLDAIARGGAVATHTPDVLTEATADMTLALLLAITRRVVEGDRLLRRGAPWSWDLGFMLGRGLRGKQLGVVGMGQIGGAVAERARAFGMTVVHHARREVAHGGSRQVTFDELVETSDVVTLHCPLTPSTHHLVDAEVLDRMRPGAYLVNTSRGPVVDEDALVEALARGHLGGAGLDVFEDEPRVRPGLLAAENVVLAPHLGSATVETRSAMVALAVDNVVDVLRGQAPRTPIRPSGRL